jgi:hypothetical protein
MQNKDIAQRANKRKQEKEVKIEFVGKTTVPPAKLFRLAGGFWILDFFSRILDGGSGMDGSSGLWILGKNFQ